VRPRLGKGFFALDLDAVQKAVAALPWVESVEARKRWPDTLVLRIYERQPFARWNEKQLVSRQGALFSVADADHGDRLARLVLADDRHHLRGADIEPHYQLLVVARLHERGEPPALTAAVGGQRTAKPLV
jgi:hypothetical protein